jgi:hypothetical protein
MRAPTLLLSLLVLVGGLHAEEPSRTPPGDGNAQHIDKLIRQLGSDDFDEREKAGKALEAVGPTALEPLRKAAAQGDDAEIRRAAGELITAIEQQAQTVGILAPRRFRLDLKEVSVADAVAELSRRSGYAVTLTGDTTALGGRKVTLQTGETTFWDALRQLCEQAGLNEAPHRPVPVGKNMASGLQPLELQAGKAGETPTHVAGSVRVRALSRKEGESKEGTVTVTLELAAEPRLQAFRNVGVPTITRAVDEHGQALQVELEPSESKGNTSSQVIVRLQAGAKGSTRLRELTGRLRVEAVTGTEPAVTIDKVLASAGQSHGGKNGSTLHVRSVVKEDNGTVRLDVGVENGQAPMAGGNLQIQGGQVQIQGGAIIVRGGGNIRVNAGGIVIDGNAPSSVNFPRLFDAKGQEYHLAEITDRNLTLQRGRVTNNATLVFRPAEAKSEPGRLVLYGQKAVTFEVPFTLKNVPVQ